MAVTKRKVFIFLLGIAGVFVVTELLLRFLPGVFASPEPYLIPDPVLGYRLRPGWSDQTGAIRINSLGFRGEEKQIPENSLLVIAIGGGDTFGRGVKENSKTWPNRLETLYRKNLPERNIRVVNAGVPGRRLFLNLIDLETRLVKMNPDAVLLLADIDHLAFPPFPRKDSEWPLRSLSGIATRLFPSFSSVRQDHWPGEATETLRQHMVSLIGICRVRNIRIVFSTIPNTSRIVWLADEEEQLLKKVFKHFTIPAVLAAIRSYNEVIRRVAFEYGVHLVNSAGRGNVHAAKGVFLDDEGALQVAHGFLNTTRKMGLHKKQSPSRRKASIL